ncbi:MAG: YhcH/YjgK/YiaL family protein [Deltaproteobacteria bacterium]|nr:YhcH/YjgK/YiaL family protein [Deltaproteobacteria bacterium]
MIIDGMKNASMYLGINKRLATAFHYLQNPDLAKLEPGKYEIEGTNVFALVQRYETKPREKGRWEAHRRHIDIQYILEGEELFGYSTLENCQAGEYDELKDFLSLAGEGDFFVVRAGTFVILAPQDVHMPGIALSSPQPVKKVVVKVSVTGGLSHVR